MSGSSDTNSYQAQAKELHQLLSVAIDGGFSDQHQRQLAELLQASPQLRQEYVKRIANEALLEERLAKPLLEEMLGDAVTQASASPEKAGVGRKFASSPTASEDRASHESRVRATPQEQRGSSSNQRKKSRTPRQEVSTSDHSLPGWLSHRMLFGKFAALAAALLIAVTVFRGTRGSSVGEVSSLENVVWAGESKMEVGDDIANRWIEIESGLVRLQLPQSHIALYGPAKFRANGPQLTELSHGTLTARVESGDGGLVVETPTSKVTDLSTSFGVTVEEKSTWVHITEGRVRVKSRGDEQSVIGSAGDVIADLSSDGQPSSLTHYQGRLLQPKLSAKWKYITQHPVDLDRNGFDQNGTAFLFLESSNRILSDDLKVNLQGSGRYRKFSRQGGVIPAGTRVHCYLLHCDPEHAEHTVGGQVEFDHEILGVITDHDRLNETNAALGAGWTLQCQDIHRGLESTPEHNSDLVTISKDRKRLSATLSTRAIDQIRILVRAN